MSTLESPPAPATDHCAAHDNPPPGCPYADPPRLRSTIVRIVLGLILVLAVNGAAGRFLSSSLALFATASSITGVTAMLLLWKFVDRRSLEAIGLTRHPGVPREILSGAVAALWLVTLASVPPLIIHRDAIRFFPDGIGRSLEHLGLYGVVLFLVALNEEIAFRGYLLRNLLLRARPWVAVVTGSLLFAAFHVVNPNITAIGVLNVFLAGAFLSLTVFLWNSLWYAVAFHWFWNLHQGVILSLPVSGLDLGGIVTFPPGGPAWLTGGAFGVEGSLVTTLLLTAASFRVMKAAPIEWNRGPEPPACARGEVCPAVPEEIRRAAERWKGGASDSH